MHIVALENVEKNKPQMEGAAGIYKQIPISKASGTPSFSFRVFTIEPGGHTPLHKHPFEHLNYVIAGSGVLVTEKTEYRVKQGDFALVLPDEVHQYKNNAQHEPLVLICAVPKEYE